jgi:hypothetical protein
LFTPLFYVLCRKLAARFSRRVPRVRIVQADATGPTSATGRTEATPSGA